MTKTNLRNKILPKQINIEDIEVSKPIQVVLPFIDYMELKVFVARYNTSISEVVRNLIKEHLYQVNNDEVDVNATLV